MKISGTNKEIVEIVNLLDPSFQCKCDPKIGRFRCTSSHDRDCLFEEPWGPEYGIYVRTYDIEYNGNKINKATCIDIQNPNSNILSGTVK